MHSRGIIFHLLFGMALVSVAASFTGCSREGRPRRRGTLVIGEISNFESLNPMGTTDAHARDIYKLMFLTLLVEQGDFLTFTPRLARSYEFSGDRKLLTFHLRDDVVWSDGIRCTAHDVEATFMAQKDPEVLWSSRHLKEYIDSVRAIDDYTAVYYFNRVYPYQLMDAVDGPIMPKHFLESIPAGEIRMIPAEDLPTNGPFRIGEWIRGQSLTLLPYDRYYEKDKPYLERAIFKIIPDQVTLLTQLRSGEIDCMESIPPGEVGSLKDNNPEIEILSYPSRVYIYIGWNNGHPLFESRTVRRALTMAIDRKLIIDNLRFGYAEECTSPFVPILWAYNPGIEPIPFDPERAVEILAGEGFTDSDMDGWLDRNGERFEFELITNYGNQIRMDVQVMVQEMLRKIGIKVNIEQFEWTVFLDRIKASDFEAMVNAWRVSTKADLSPIWACKARGPGGYNRINYCNAVVDSLNDLACGMLDFEEAKPLFFQVQEIIYEEQPYTFLYVGHALNALHRRYRNVKPNAVSFYHNLHEWRVGDE